MGIIIIGAIVGFLAGIAFAYSLLEKRLKKQKQQHLEQTRRITEEIELAQLSRMRQTGETQQGERESQLRQAIAQHENQLRQVAADYENQLRQVIAERDRAIEQARSELGQNPNANLQQTLQSLEAEREQLQANVQSLEAERERQLLELEEKLHQDYQGQIDRYVAELERQHQLQLQQTARDYQNREVELQSRVQSLQEQYENQLRAAHEQLRVHEAQMQATIESLQQQYETKLTQQEVPHSSQFNQIEVAEPLEQTSVPEQLSIPFSQTEASEQLEPTEYQPPQSMQFPATSVSGTLEPIEYSPPPSMQFQETEVAGNSEPIEYSPPPSMQFQETEVGETLEDNEIALPQSMQFYETEVAEPLEPDEVPQPQPTQFDRPAGIQLPQISTPTPRYYSVAQLMGCVQSRNPDDRKFAAVSLGRMAAANALRSDGQRAIETLGKLTQDANFEVRLAAVEALGTIKSEKVIPLLQKALRDSNSAVAKSASAALNKFKFYPRTPDPKPKNIDVKKPKR
ncbi:MAG: HEAT repeat domain-containing protein [Oscillatoriaceae cyanobacterium Prado104]|nr:HEAT repeat domain-containing protein [Oscillatoriaceae cyanobacterium Prado104]